MGVVFPDLPWLQIFGQVGGIMEQISWRCAVGWPSYLLVIGLRIRRHHPSSSSSRPLLVPGVTWHAGLHGRGCRTGWDSGTPSPGNASPNFLESLCCLWVIQKCFQKYWHDMDNGGIALGVGGLIKVYEKPNLFYCCLCEIHRLFFYPGDLFVLVTIITGS